MPSPNPSPLPRFHPGTAARLALLGLRRAPSTTVIAVLILTLGLWAPTTFFSILVGAIRPLPVPDGQRIVRLDVTRPDQAGAVPVSLDDVRALGALEFLDAMGAFRVGGSTSKIS